LDAFQVAAVGIARGLDALAGGVDLPASGLHLGLSLDDFAGDLVHQTDLANLGLLLL